MNADEAVRRFSELFHETYVRFHKRARADDYRVTPESLAVLRHLVATGPITVREACDHFDRSQSAMSELLARLEGRGLIERIADERDRRRTLVWLTPQGRDVHERSNHVLSPQLLRHAFKQLSDEEREQIVRQFQRLLATEKADSAFEETENEP